MSEGDIFFKEVLKEKFGLSSLDKIERLGGFSADNYNIKIDKKEFFLKKYKDKASSEIENVENILNILSQCKLPVVNPLPTSDGCYHFSIRGCNAELYPWVNGVTLHEDTLSANALDSSAKVLASFHKCKMPKGVILDNAKTLNPSIQQFKKEYSKIISVIKKESHGKDIDTLTLSLIKLKKELLEVVIEYKNFNDFFSVGDLVHGDFHNENLLFDANNNVVALLDFEAVHTGHRMQDVINFILFACCNTGFAEKNISLAKVFLKSYGRAYPFTIQELHFSVHYALFRLSSSLFLEKLLYKERDIFFVPLLERDLKKLSYFKDNIEGFISILEDL